MLPGFTTNLGARLTGGGGSSLTNIPTSPINILIVGNDSSTVGNALGVFLTNVSTAIGWPTVTFTNASTTGDIFSIYSAATYDVVLCWTDYTPSTNTYTTINNFLAAGKGVIMFVFGHTTAGFTYSNFTGGASAVQISNIGGYTTLNSAQTVTDATGHSILYQVTGVAANQGYYNTGFTSVNGATQLGTWSSGINTVIYKDPAVGTSRRVDINMWPGGGWAQNGADGNFRGVRMSLNACFWAARKTS